jgi:hypothetical protein
MMDRRRLLLTSLASALAAPLVAAAQQGKVPRIGVLAPGDPTRPARFRGRSSTHSGRAFATSDTSRVEAS